MFCQSFNLKYGMSAKTATIILMSSAPQGESHPSLRLCHCGDFLCFWSSDSTFSSMDVNEETLHHPTQSPVKVSTPAETRLAQGPPLSFWAVWQCPRSSLRSTMSFSATGSLNSCYSWIYASMTTEGVPVITSWHPSADSGGEPSPYASVMSYV